MLLIVNIDIIPCKTNLIQIIGWYGWPTQPTRRNDNVVFNMVAKYKILKTFSWNRFGSNSSFKHLGRHRRKRQDSRNYSSYIPKIKNKRMILNHSSGISGVTLPENINFQEILIKYNRKYVVSQNIKLR